MYLLDTNVVSELRKVASGKAAPEVAKWQLSVEQTACFISVVTLMELEIGVLRVERRDTAQGALLRTWLDRRVVPAFSGRVLPIGEVEALRCARLHVPDRCPERDALIAATALTHGLTLVTRNVADFASTGVALLDPWQAPTLHDPVSDYQVAGH